MKKRTARIVGTIGLLTLALTASNTHAQGLGFSTSPMDSSGAQQVVALDAKNGAPLVGAAVALQTPSLAAPVTVGTTDSSGMIALDPALLNGANVRIITVKKAGFETVTFASGPLGSVTLKLEALKAPKQAVVSGKTGGWEAVTDKQKVYAGLTFPSLSAADIADFDPNDFISPLDDTVQVFGNAAHIPSNIAFPKQSVQVSFLSVNLDKPTYRLPVAVGSPKRLVQIQGRVPSKAVMDAQGGGLSAYLNVIDQLKMARVGVSAPLTVSSDTIKDQTSTHEVQSALQVKSPKPPFPADLLVASVADMDGDHLSLAPTDLKLAARVSDTSVKAVTVATPKTTLGKAMGVVALAMDLEENNQSVGVRRLSGSLSNASGTNAVTPQAFLDVDKLADTSAVAKSYAIEAPEHGTGLLVFTTDSTTVWKVIALPEAGMVNVSSEPLKGLGKTVELAKITLDFGTHFDATQIHELATLGKLERFTRTHASAGVAKPLSALRSPLERLFGWFGN